MRVGRVLRRAIIPATVAENPQTVFTSISSNVTNNRARLQTTAAALWMLPEATQQDAPHD